MTEDAGSVVTVNGPVNPDEMGVTLPHEHMFLDASDWFTVPDSAIERKKAKMPVTLENLGFIRQNLYGNIANMRLNSYEEAREEILFYKRAGGDTVVDLTPKHVGRDPEMVRKLANETGLKFIHGTGYYVRAAQPDYLDKMTVAEIRKELISDVLDGIGDTNIRAGVIGELGVSGRIHEVEEKVVRAGAQAAAKTGAPLNIHTPGRTPHSQKNRTHPPSRWGLKLLDICEEEGLPPNRIILSHLDRTIYEDLSYQKSVADRGAYIEYDLWGLESYLSDYNDALPSDIRRSEWVSELVKDGYADRLLFSHDVWSKTQRVAYGGYGYAHLLDNVPSMLQTQGVSYETYNQIVKENPKSILTFTDAP